MAKSVFIFGGYILCSGVLKDGTPWSNANVLLAQMPTDGRLEPLSTKVVKAKRDADIMQSLRSLPIPSPVSCSFDINGKLSSISPEIEEQNIPF